jgi:hypothetical protein
MLAKEIATDQMVRKLEADGPDPAERDPLGLFGQLTGSWDVDMTAYDETGKATSYVAEWHLGWILQGRALQDVIITRSIDTGDVVGYGTTVRTFDPSRGLWWIVWQDPLAGEFAVLLAREEEDRIVLDGQWSIGQTRDSKGRFRWTFSQLRPDGFHWEAHLSKDEGATWQLRETIEARRRSAA